jgi:putative glutamine amidotransferase
MLCLSICCYSVFCQQERKPEPKEFLLIAHPTQANLERLNFLIEQDIIVLPPSLSLLLVYHQNERYPYRESRAWLDTARLHFRYQLAPLDCPLDLRSLFEKNECSDDFVSLLSRSRGMILLGGADILPAIYGEEMHLLTRATDPMRNFWETSLVFHLLGNGKESNTPPYIQKDPRFALLGICLGMQSLNVGSGGSLIQDIPSQVYEASTVEEVLGFPPEIHHRNYLQDYEPLAGHPSGLLHPISLEEGVEAYLPDVRMETNPLVYSSHHQAMGLLGNGMRVLARSTDGEVVEIIGHKDYPAILGVQFHPELPFLYEEERMLPDETSLGFHLELWKQFSKNLKR